MANEHSPIEEYRRSIHAKIETLHQMIHALKSQYTIPNINNLKNELHKITSSAHAYGFLEASDLCMKLEIDLNSKDKNFYLSHPDKEWFEDLDLFLYQLEKSFRVRVVEEKKNEPPKVAAPVEKKEPRKKIVICDDDDDILKLLEHEFKEIGFSVVAFKTGKETLSYILNPDHMKDVFLIILDRMLPDMDGLAILQQFNAQSQIHVPVLILSVLSSESDILEGIQGGAVDYIAKPFSVFMLMQKALNLLRAQG